MCLANGDTVGPATSGCKGLRVTDVHAWGQGRGSPHHRDLERMQGSSEGGKDRVSSPCIYQEIDRLTRHLKHYPGLGLGYGDPQVWAPSIFIKGEKFQGRVWGGNVLLGAQTLAQ